MTTLLVPPCRHCGKTPARRARGLCWGCYYAPGVRDLYPTNARYTQRGLGSFNGHTPLPDTPTSALPGSPEKLDVFAERCRHRRALWHPEDAVIDDEGERATIPAIRGPHFKPRRLERARRCG